METKGFLLLRKLYATEIVKAVRQKNADGLLTLLKATPNIDTAAVDQAFRDILLDKLIGHITDIEQLVDFAIVCATSNFATTTVPIVLLSDAFEVQTLDQCEEMFNYVEKNVHTWKEEFFFAACKNNLLRMCNDLLRRLSRSQSTVFCGRILLFLARFFPFSERSGLNIVSEFNLENVTEYGMEGDDMGTDDIFDDEGEAKVKIDYNLYCKFWALQDFFRSPNQCYDRIRWKVLEAHTFDVLKAFASCKREETTSRKRKADQIEPDEELEEGETEAHHFFAKFLTNPKLLSLQLSDPNFRRNVLIQFLILFQYLTTTVKFRPENFGLTTAQTDWVKDTELQVIKLLSETPPNGKKFAETIKHLLSREEMWNNWKNDGCKEFKRPEVTAATDKAPKKFLLGGMYRNYRNHGKFDLGNPRLTNLWNICPDNLDACRHTDRDFMPPLENFLETEGVQDNAFEWRALRLLAKQSSHFFTVINKPATKISDYLDKARKESKKEKEEIVPESSQTAEEVPNGDAEKDLEAEMEAELIKTEAQKAEKDEKHEHKEIKATPEMLRDISAKIGDDWKKLGAKLDVTDDVMLLFEEQHTEVVDQCRQMLQVWFSEDEDASLDNLAYYLEGLELTEAADLAKKFIEDLS